MIVLKDARPCPFCGSVPTDYEHLSDSDGERIRVYCSDCDVAGPSGGNLEKAIQAWNYLPRVIDLEQVRRERDYLAENMPNSICPDGKIQCKDRTMTSGKVCYPCLLCWLNAAEKFGRKTGKK